VGRSVYDPATLDDVVEILAGIGRILQCVDAKLELVVAMLGDDDEED
jgi:hypothetical protein